MEKEDSELRCQKHNEKEQIQAQPQVLGQKDKEVMEEKKQGEGTIDDFKAQVQTERLKTQEEFRCLKKNLEEEERSLLDRRKNLEGEERSLLDRRKNLEGEERSLLDRRKNLEGEERSLLDRQKNLEEEESFCLGWLLWLEQEGDKLSAEQLSSSRMLTTSPRAKQQMPPRDLLRDMKVTLSRTSTSSSRSLYRSQGFQFTNPTSVPVDLEKRINETILRYESTSESKKKLTGHVTLNPMSADPELTMSQDLKTVSLAHIHPGTGNKQAKPRSLDSYRWVLGSQGLSSGCQVWEVKLQGTEKGACVVGVAMELAPGKHCLKHVWALLVSDWDCQPVTESSALENLPILLRKVSIYLDLDHGKVIFFNPITEEQIYTFQESFTGEIFPFFGLWNSGKITLIPQSCCFPVSPPSTP